MPELLIDGQPLKVGDGTTVAAALLLGGDGSSRTSVSGQRRAPFCGMGVCQECLVIVDGHRSRRACMTEASPGLDVRAQDDATWALVPSMPLRQVLTPKAVDLAITMSNHMKNSNSGVGKAHG